MKLIKKYLQGKPVLLNDSPAQVALTTLGRDSKAGEKIRLDQAVTLRIINGETPHYIFIDHPVAFNYNDGLMVRGSELLKYPLLYTHMGWTDTANSGILPDLYYRIGNDGSLDTTHYTAFNNMDTYTPISEDILPYILNYSFKKNNLYGLQDLINRQGRISQGKDETFQEQIRVPIGFSPGADAAYLLYLLNPTKENADNFRSVATTGGAANSAIAGMHPAGSMVFAPTMGIGAYDRLSSAKDWSDYVIGAGEGVVASLSLLGPMSLAYRSLRSAVSPKYALRRELYSVQYSPNWDAYYGYRFNSNTNPNFHIFDVTNRQNAIVLPNTTHIHSPEIRALVDIRPKVLEKILKEGTVLHGHSVSDLKPGLFSLVEFTHPDGYVMTPSSIKTASEYPTIHYRRTGTYDPELEPDWGYKPDRKHIFEEKTKSGDVVSVTQYSPNRYVYAGDVDFKTNKGVARVHADEKGNIVIDTIYPEGTINLFNSSNASKTFKGAQSDLQVAIERYLLSALDFNKGYAFVEDYYDPLERPIVNPYRPTKNNNRVSFVNFDPKLATITSGSEDWNSAVGKIMDYTNTTEFTNRAKRAGLKVEDILDSFRRSFNNTLVNDIGYRENPVGYIGESTFDDFNGQDLFLLLLLVDKNLAGMTEELFISKLTPEERTMYDNAKLKRILVALSSNNVEDWQTALEEALHRVLYSEDDEVLKIINDYNESLAKGIEARSVEFADPRELVVRAREAARMRSLVSNQELKHFYTSRFGQSIPDDQIDKMFYLDLLSGNPRLIKAFPQLQNSKTNRLLNLLNNLYEHNGNFWQLLKDVVYNDNSNYQNDYSLA